MQDKLQILHVSVCMLTSCFDTSIGLSVCLSIHTFVYLFYGKKKQYIALRKKASFVIVMLHHPVLLPF